MNQDHERLSGEIIDMLFFHKYKRPRQIPKEYYVDPSKVTNSSFFVFVAASSKGVKPVLDGLSPDEVRLEIDVYRLDKISKPEVDAIGIPLSKPVATCKYWRSFI